MNDLLALANIHPILADIGAAGGAPRIWGPIAPQSIYVGFDPDLRDMTDSTGGEFHRRFVLNKAVTSDPSLNAVEFHLTAYPHCSSTLAPDLSSLSHYSFCDYFTTNSRVKVPAITLDDTLALLRLNHIDWMKLDTQGTDLRLFQSLNESARSRVLALDVEPSLVDSYQGEDLFVDTQAYLSRNGFWLSNLNIGRVARIRKSTLQAIVPNSSVQQIFAHRKMTKSPVWCEARYLRTLDWLEKTGCGRREYALLWTFAMLDKQFGFALDIALEYRKLFGPDSWAELMQRRAAAHLKVPPQYVLIAAAKRILPAAVIDLFRAIKHRRGTSALQG
jgi:hypothetical protein